MLPRRGSLKRAIIDRIDEADDQVVFLSRDFRDLSSPPAVSRALRELVDGRFLVKLGYGVYARAEENRITEEPMPAAPGGFGAAAREALDRLGVPWAPSQAEVDFIEGRTLQIPVNAAVRIRTRFARRIAFGGMQLHVDRR